MWVHLRAAAAAGHHVTGIVNPSSGPNVEGGDLTLYTTILNDFMNKGFSRTQPDNDELDSLTVSICMCAHEEKEPRGEGVLLHRCRVWQRVTPIKPSLWLLTLPAAAVNRKAGLEYVACT